MDWLTRELLTGFQKLICLSLDRQPAGEVMPGTVQAWAEAILDGREFDEALDASRFRRAFLTLAGTRTTWPAPRDFLDALPPRDQLQLARESRKADPAVAAAACAAIARELAGREIAGDLGLDEGGCIPDRKTAAAGPDA